MSGTDPETWEHLAGALRELGWSAGPTFMMVHREPSARARNPELTVRAVGPESADLELLYTQDGVVDRGFLFARSAFPRTGGEYLVGYARGRPPACCSGWFAAGGVARFRHVLTAPWARNRGYAGTLIQYVQSHPQVRRRDALAIFTTPDGPVKLYEALGFRTAGLLWEAVRAQ